MKEPRRHIRWKIHKKTTNAKPKPQRIKEFELQVVGGKFERTGTLKDVSIGRNERE